MLQERHRTDRVGLVLALVGAAVLGSLAGIRVRDLHVEWTGPVRTDRTATLPDRLAALEAAVANRDRTRAVLVWWDAYGLAVRTRTWDAMATVGDAALEVDALMNPDGPSVSGFRAEARQAYLVALFRARDARAPEGIERVANAFAALGDDEVAEQARALRLEALR
jgi:hypothetical protein